MEPQVGNQEALKNVCTASFLFPLPKLCSLRMVTLGYPSLRVHRALQVSGMDKAGRKIKMVKKTNG